MAVTIAPSTLTTAGRTSVIAARRKALDEHGRQAALRKQLSAALAASTRAVGANRARQVYGARFSSAQAAEKAAKSRLDSEQARYNQFGADYNRLMALSGQNPTAESALSKLIPYDPQTAAERLGAQTARNNALIQIKTGRDRLAEDYQTAGRQLEDTQDDRFRALLSNFAGRGLARSSGYAQSFGDESADYTRRRTELDTAHQRGTAQAGLDTAHTESSYQAALAAILANTTGRLSANAGQLGLAGNRDLPLLLELARRRLTTAGGG